MIDAQEIETCSMIIPLRHVINVGKCTFIKPFTKYKNYSIQKIY